MLPNSLGYPPMSRLLPKRAFALRAASALAAIFVALVVLLAPRVAQAQLTVATPASLPRVDVDGKDVPKRDVRFKPEGISFQDCKDRQGIRFSLTLAAPETNASLEAWVSNSGADCSAQTARTGAAAVCWRVVRGIPLSTNPIVILPVRKIIGGRTDTNNEEGKDTEDVCGKVDLTNLTLQFLYFSPGNLAQAAYKVDVPIQADTVGPVAPTGMKILPGNTRLSISFNALGEGGVVELSTIRAYCDPDPVGTISSNTCDGSTDGDAVADADGDAGCQTTSTPLTEGGTCASNAFIDRDGKPIQPDLAFNAKYECGNLPVSSTGSVVIARTLRGAALENRRTYAVALAASDSFLNVGALSSVVCEYPEETEDFWSDYKNNGGRAGGGFCSVENGAAPLGSFAVMGIVIVFGTSLVRRLTKKSVRRKGR